MMNKIKEGIVMKFRKSIIIAVCCIAILNMSGCSEGSDSEPGVSETLISETKAESVSDTDAPVEEITVYTFSETETETEIETSAETTDVSESEAVEETTADTSAAETEAEAIEASEPEAAVVNKINEKMSDIITDNEKDCADIGLDFAENQEKFKADKEAFLADVNYAIYGISQIDKIEVDGKNYLVVGEYVADTPEYYGSAVGESLSFFDAETGDEAAQVFVESGVSIENALIFYKDDSDAVHLYTEQADNSGRYEGEAVMFTDYVYQNGKFTETAMGVYDAADGSNLLGDDKPDMSNPVEAGYKTVNINSWLLSMNEEGTCSVMLEDGTVLTSYDIALKLM